MGRPSCSLGARGQVRRVELRRPTVVLSAHCVSRWRLPKRKRIPAAISRKWDRPPRGSAEGLVAGQPYTTEVGVRSSSRLPSAIVPGGPRVRVRTVAPEVSRSSWRDTKKQKRGSCTPMCDHPSKKCLSSSSLSLLSSSLLAAGYLEKLGLMELVVEGASFSAGGRRPSCSVDCAATHMGG